MVVYRAVISKLGLFMELFWPQVVVLLCCRRRRLWVTLKCKDLFIKSMLPFYKLLGVDQSITFTASTAEFEKNLGNLT